MTSASGSTAAAPTAGTRPRMPDTTPPITDAADAVVQSYPAPSSGPLRAVLLAIARHWLTALGAVLVSRGFADTATADLAVTAFAQEAVGALLMVAGASGAAMRASLSHNRWADAWAVLTGVATLGDPPK